MEEKASLSFWSMVMIVAMTETTVISKSLRMSVAREQRSLAEKPYKIRHSLVSSVMRI